MSDEQVVSDYQLLKNFMYSFIRYSEDEDDETYIDELSLQDLKKLRELSQFAIVDKLLEYSPVMFGNFVKIDKENF